MLSNSRFWIGVVVGIAAYHGWNMYKARQTS